MFLTSLLMIHNNPQDSTPCKIEQRGVIFNTIREEVPLGTLLCWGENKSTFIITCVILPAPV
jgi:hypothetical protein